MLAIDLREHFRRIREEALTFSPSTQVVVLHALLRDAGQVLIPAELAPQLGYSAMTMTAPLTSWRRRTLPRSRSAAGSVVCVSTEAEKRYGEGSALSPQPVSKRLFIRHATGVEGAMRAGLTALARFSMLAPPEYTTYALSREDWKALRQRHKIIEVPTQDPDASEVEVWWYPPALFAEDGVVDPLSLYLSLKEDHDERTETALEVMMEKFKW